MIISEGFHWEAAGERLKRTLSYLVNQPYVLTPAEIAIM
jgi:hypothetical protein